MKNSNISAVLVIFAALCVIAIPHASKAYFTIDQKAEAITDHTALFTVTYEFGLVDHDIYMPIFAARNIGTSSSEKKVGYSIHNENNSTVTMGNTAAIVLADLPVVNGMYKIEKGAARKLTLLVLYTTPDAYIGGTFKTQVEKMPYFVDLGNGTLQTLQLNPSELQYYVTPKTTLSQ